MGPLRAEEKGSATKSTGEQYYEYVLTYVDNILAISEHPDKLMELLKRTYLLKPESVGKPSTYLGVPRSQSGLFQGLGESAGQCQAKSM